MVVVVVSVCVCVCVADGVLDNYDEVWVERKRGWVRALNASLAHAHAMSAP